MRSWQRATDSGGVLDCLFCEACGSRIHHTGAGSATVSVKGGSLDEPVDMTNAVHIWVTRKLPGVLIPEHARQFEEEPY
jgi:hypothetical protein